MGIFNTIDLSDDGIYKVNPKLKNEIFSKIPAGFTNLEQALFIYNELCKKLQYSYNYYLNEIIYVHRFTDPDNIEKIDGQKEKDVVCFTFDRIFLKLLYDKGIIDYTNFWMNAGYSIEHGYIRPEHSIIEISIDDISYWIDATIGVFKNNDLSQAKFSNFKISGWHNTINNKKNNDILQNAIEKVQANSTKLEDAVYDYVKTKAQEDNYIKWSIDARANMFMKYISDYGHTKDIQILAYAYKLKHLFFTEKELDSLEKNNTKVSFHFMRNTEPACLSMLLLYNVEDKIKAQEIDLLDKSVEVKKTSVEELLADTNNGKLKYLTASKSINAMIEPVVKASNLYKKAETL